MSSNHGAFVRNLAAVSVFAGAVVIATTASAEPSAQAAWSRPAAKGTIGAGFMVLINPGKTPDALVAVESPGARQVHIHQSSVTDGVASMQMVSSVALPAGGRVTFAPGGYHLMFMDLAKTQKVGDNLPATLVFASGVRLKVGFGVVLKAPTSTPTHAH